MHPNVLCAKVYAMPRSATETSFPRKPPESPEDSIPELQDLLRRKTWAPRKPLLVGGLRNPSEKYERQLGWLETQYEWENKKCSKPSTRLFFSSGWCFQPLWWMVFVNGTIPSFEMDSITRATPMTLETPQMFTGWWLGHPSEKYMSSSVGMMNATQLIWANKIDVPNQQPGIIVYWPTTCHHQLEVSESWGGPHFNIIHFRWGFFPQLKTILRAWGTPNFSDTSNVGDRLISPKAMLSCQPKPMQPNVGLGEIHIDVRPGSNPYRLGFMSNKNSTISPCILFYM